MYTKQKLALSTIASLLLATSIFASQGMRSEQYGCQSDKKNKQQHHEKDHNNNRFIIHILHGLDLTKEQQLKVDSIVDNFRKNRNKIFDYFTSEGFDKEKFIQAKLHKKENMIKAQANMIENIYGVLTTVQKKELKDKLDKFFTNKGDHMGRRMDNFKGRNCQQ